MNSRDRALKAINHLPTDHVPLDYKSRSDVTNGLIFYLGLNSKEELYKRLGIDFRRIPIEMHDTNFENRTTGKLEGHSASCGCRYIMHDDGTFEDEWGVIRCVGQDKLYERWISGPFVEHKNIDSFNWPDLKSFDSVQFLRSRCLAYQNEYALCGRLNLPFKVAWHMRGFENFLCDMLTDPLFAKDLLDRIALYEIEKGMRFIKAGVDIIEIIGDLAMQDRLFIHPNSWREIEKPILSEMIKSFRKVNPNIFIFYHSDGNIMELIPDFIEIGVDIIDPIQPESMDPIEVKKKYGDKITLHGTISVQTTLPKGSVEDVKRAVYDRIRTCGRNGGLIIGPTNNLQNDIPFENIIAMYDAVLNYSKK